MSRAEDRALEAYPIVISQHSDNCKEYDSNESDRLTFIEGYQQAEKDMTDKAKVSSGWDGFYYGQGYKQAMKNLELTWEDINSIKLIIEQVECDYEEQDKKLYTKYFYEEVLKQFKERKER